VSEQDAEKATCLPHDDLTEQTLRNGLFVCVECGSPSDIEQPPVISQTSDIPPREGRTPIIHEAGCGWEIGPYCTCGADPERIEEN
jgi:hypothetical protein